MKEKGYKILAEHWTCRYGELDLVAYKPAPLLNIFSKAVNPAEKGGVYVFVEVKTRRSRAFGAPEEAVPFWKQKKLRAAAEMFLMKKKLKDVLWQIDLVAIELDRVSGKYEIRHLENVVEGGCYGRY